MSRLALALLASAVLPVALSSSPAHAEKRTRTLRDRKPGVLLRATRMGYTFNKTLKGQRTDTIKQINSTLLYSDHSGVPFSDHSMQIYASWSDRDAAIAGQKSPYEARLTVERHERTIAKVDALLAKLPNKVTGGFRIGKLFGNRLLKKQGYSTLRNKMRDIYRATTEHFKDKIGKHKERIGQIEAVLHDHLDQTYIQQEPQVQAALKKMSGQKLFDHALSLVQQLDGMAHHKEIRRETVERGQSQSQTTKHSAASSKRIGLDGRGRLRDRETGDAYATEHTRSSSSYSRDQLLLHAANYTVNVRNTHGRQSSKTALTPIEARMMLGIIFELNATSRALDKTDPQRAASLHRWIEHSKIVFDVPNGSYVSSRSYKKPEFNSTRTAVQLGHAHRDAIQLQSSGLVSKKLARHLDKQLRKPIENVLTAGSALLQQ